MSHLVRCRSCHREERWTLGPSGDPPRVEIVQEGGSRRPKGHPQAVRGRLALDAVQDQLDGHGLVGVCDGCGQYLVGPHPALPAIDVEIATPAGALTIQPAAPGGTVGLPDGGEAPSAARAWLEAQYPAPTGHTAREQATNLAFFGVLLGPIALWLFALFFVLAFFASIIQGAPDVVSGVPGLDGAMRGGATD